MTTLTTACSGKRVEAVNLNCDEDMEEFSEIAGGNDRQYAAMEVEDAATLAEKTADKCHSVEDRVERLAVGVINGYIEVVQRTDAIFQQKGVNDITLCILRGVKNDLKCMFAREKLNDVKSAIKEEKENMKKDKEDCRSKSRDVSNILYNAHIQALEDEELELAEECMRAIHCLQETGFHED